MLDFEAVYGGSNPSEKTYVITNKGQSQLSYTTRVAYAQAYMSWFSQQPGAAILPVGGALTHTCSVSLTSLNAGSYSATNFIVAPNAINSPQTILVNLTVAKSPQTIDFTVQSNQWTTNAVQLSATASSGLPVSFAINDGPAIISNGTNLSFTGEGSVIVVASQAGNSNWLAADGVSRTLQVTKASAQLTLTDLTHTYDGNPQSATVHSVPSVSSVDLKYNSLTNIPMNAGSYTVTATVVDSLYQGGTTTTLTIAKADQSITFYGLTAQKTTNEIGLQASASSELPVTFDVVSGPATVTTGTNLTFTGAGSVTLAAVQAGNSNYNAAAHVERTFTVNRSPQSTLRFTPTTPQTYQTAQTLTASGGTGTGTLTYAVLSGPGSIESGNVLRATSGTGTISVQATRAADAFYAAASITSEVSCAKATQTVTFPAVSGQLLTNTVGLSATASSGGTVSFMVVSGPAAILGGTNLSFSSTGSVSVAAAQAGDDNWLFASATNTFGVGAGQLQLLTLGGAVIQPDAPADWALGTDFGTVGTNESTQISLILTNVGAYAVNLSSIVTNGSNAFSVQGFPEELAPASAATITVTFAPSALGIHTAAVVLANDTVDNPFTLNLAGAGVKPGEIGLNAVYLTYTSTYGSTNVAKKTYVMTNKGEAAFAYTNSNSALWYSQAVTNGTLAAGSTITFTGAVHESGLNAGTYVETNTIISPTALNSPQEMLVRLKVAKAAQTISFGVIADQVSTNTPGIKRKRHPAICRCSL